MSNATLADSVTGPPGAPSDGDSQHRRVLVIDDERAVREAFRRSLLLAGFDVVVAGGGAEGLQILGTDPAIGLVLLDLNMPQIDGKRFRAIQLSDPRLADIPTVIVTGHHVPAELRQELRAHDYMAKPVGRSALLALVGRYCTTIGNAVLPLSQPTRGGYHTQK